MMSSTLAIRSTAALTLLLAAACGSNSLVIGGDPEREALSGVSGSAAAEASGGTGLGGSAPGGAGTASGGAAGAVPLGSAGTSASAPILGGDYPWVVWAQGRGFEQACLPDGDVWGATCWSHATEGTAVCEADGTPFCNACNCMLSCVTGSDCPTGTDGQPAVCLAAAAESGLCFVSCENGSPCPTGMTCSVHPELGSPVCMWVDDDSSSMPAPR
jgi:hypothetical protein